MNLLECTVDALAEVLASLQLPSFRIKQIYKWLQNGAEFDAMSDIPLALREKLSASYTSQPVKIHEKFVSKDKSVKYLYRLCDGNIIEGVYMPHAYGDTLCVSTQVGCRMGCSFCASGIGGLVRNLDAGEILGQVVAVNAAHGGTIQKRAITNIVLMGSGEPLDNYEQVTKFLRLVSCAEGLHISQRNISLSTCGLVENIRRLADDGFSVTLSLSLHATTDESRQALMPIAKKYSLQEVMQAVKYYFDKTGRRIIFEYAMVKGKNTNFLDAKRLGELSHGFACHVNLIKLNYVKEKNLQACSDAEIQKFCGWLTQNKVSATVRRSFGADVGGACGQLRRRYLQDNAKKGR